VNRMPVGARFSAPVQTDHGTHPASCEKEKNASFSWVKRPGRGVDQTSPSSTEVSETVLLYLYSLRCLHGLFQVELHLYPITDFRIGCRITSVLKVSIYFVSVRMAFLTFTSYKNMFKSLRYPYANNLYTGRFIMFSMITNIYNKKTKGPTFKHCQRVTIQLQ